MVFNVLARSGSTSRIAEIDELTDIVTSTIGIAQ
jgi:hypothetical protein